MSEFDDTKKKNRVVPAIICGVCLVLIVVVVISVINTKKNQQQMGAFPGGPGGMGKGPSQTVVSVKTETAVPETLKDYVITNGEIDPQSSVDVLPEMGGKVVAVYVMLGSTVQKGDLLAEVDPSQPGTQYAKSPVYAPISGTITKTPSKIGATVSTATVITVIGDIENLQISANVPERYIAALKQGLKADIVLEAYPNEVFTATVTRVSPVIDSTSRTKEVILNFDRNDWRINAGMFAKVKLWTYEYKNSPAVPVDAVVEKGSSKYVYVLNADGNTVSLREVTTGNTVDNEIQLLTGVDAGEKVVVEGMRALSDGASVIDITDGVKAVDDSNFGNAGLPPEGLPSDGNGPRS